MCIIKNSEKSLRKLLIKKFIYDAQDEHFWDDSLLLIRIICENCPLIEHLSIVFPPSKSHYIEFENLLKSCQRLEALSLILEHINNRFDDSLFEQKKLEAGQKLSDILIRSAPIRLREINDFRFSPKTLREVLEDWKGLPTISILLSNPDYQEEEYIDSKFFSEFLSSG
ncbi:11151_t:CDS:2 [Funneliformis mosseae]|uniref:11151_t:CDS:1 n=1 Tax=Funneliformis mosseae TaxID=27381 RepID=A0A9N8V378_FUNMO|nr:11151_t:CDS:2 [Funneliformis mosseae]